MGYEYVVILVWFCDIWGLYEIYFNIFVMIVKDVLENVMQCIGYGQMVEMLLGEVFYIYLCGCLLEGLFLLCGCEIGIVKCKWGDDGWLYLVDGGLVLLESVVFVEFVLVLKRKLVFYDFSVLKLFKDFQWFCIFDYSCLFEMIGDVLSLIG